MHRCRPRRRLRPKRHSFGGSISEYLSTCSRNCFLRSYIREPELLYQLAYCSTLMEKRCISVSRVIGGRICGRKGRSTLKLRIYPALGTYGATTRLTIAGTTKSLTLPSAPRDAYITSVAHLLVSTHHSHVFKSPLTSVHESVIFATSRFSRTAECIFSQGRSHVHCSTNHISNGRDTGTNASKRFFSSSALQKDIKNTIKLSPVARPQMPNAASFTDRPIKLSFPRRGSDLDHLSI